MRGYARECLRSATRSLHAALDARLALPTRVSREGYARYLLTNWPFSSIERGLEEAGVELFLPDWKHRRRRFDLSHDLKRLDVDPPACPSLQIASDRGTILGWTYVLEGSALDPRSSCKLSRRRGRPRSEIQRAFCGTALVQAFGPPSIRFCAKSMMTLLRSQRPAKPLATRSNASRTLNSDGSMRSKTCPPAALSHLSCICARCAHAQGSRLAMHSGAATETRFGSKQAPNGP